MRKILLAGILGSLLISEFASAQSFFAMRRQRSLILVAGTGTSSYYGELSNDNDYLQANLNFHFGLQYYLTNRIAIRSEFSYFRLSGDDAKASPEGGRRERNLNFTSNNFELNAVGILNLNPQGRTFYQRPAFNIYGFVGIGVTYYNPSTEFNGRKYQLRPQQTELVSYGYVTPVIPIGIGLRFKLGPFTNLTFEGGFRKTFTDYLDDVSTVHHVASSYSSTLAASLADRRAEIGIPLAPEGYIRGNPSTSDAYMLYSVKLEYYLPVNFLQPDRGAKTFKHKRKSFYRYNKRGGLKK